MLKRILIGLGALVVVAGVAIGTTLYVTRAPEPGEFYDPPDIAADTPPGTLLRSEPFTPEGIPEGAKAWRILYTTLGMDGKPVAVSGMVVVDPSVSEAPRPVVAWAHGSIGIARGCALTLLGDPSLGIPQLPAMIAKGWLVVATDYVGLGAPGVHPFLVSDVTGRAVIDSVRAAHQLDTGVELDDRYALWGESQGGHAVLSAGQLATEGYAPELMLVGVAAAAPASDLGPLMKAAQGQPAGKVLTSQAVVSWTRVYPELSFDEAIAPLARAPVQAIARRCLFPDFFVVAAQTILIPKKMLAIDVTTDPRWAKRLAENTPNRPIGVPLIIEQGQKDFVVAPAVQRAWVAKRCAEGQSIDFRELPDSGHVDVLKAGGPILVDWTSRLLAGEPVPPGCSS